MKHTIAEIHLAAQYLAAAGINYIKRKEDDSHTNFAWDINKCMMIGRKLGQTSHQLALNLRSFDLIWLRSNQEEGKINLNGRKHFQIINWINTHVKDHLAGHPLKYDLPYGITHHNVDKEYTYQFNSKHALLFIEKLNMTQLALEQFLADNYLTSEIRLWPHHFDLGIYTQIEINPDLFMSAGLAIPDRLVDDCYIYASGWHQNEAIDPKEFGPLDLGTWRSDWKGATLASKDIEKEQALHFLEQTKTQFKRHKRND